jgi:pyruvate/2-oxoglutarate dehydrogenase complex dihydrolipoamide dehydrogenase (E3) component
VVIAAVGSRPLIPDIPGIKAGMKRKKVVTGRDVLSGKVKLGKKAVVIGGGMIGCEIADTLAAKGQEVVIIEILPELAMDGFPSIRKILLKRLEGEKIRAFTRASEERITNGGIEIVDHSGERVLVEADKVILATGSIPNTTLSRSLQGTAAEFHRIGDCKEPRKILEAIHEGYTVARNL